MATQLGFCSQMYRDVGGNTPVAMRQLPFQDNDAVSQGPKMSDSVNSGGNAVVMSQ